MFDRAQDKKKSPNGISSTSHFVSGRPILHPLNLDASHLPCFSTQFSPQSSVPLSLPITHPSATSTTNDTNNHNNSTSISTLSISNQRYQPVCAYSHYHCPQTESNKYTSTKLQNLNNSVRSSPFQFTAQQIHCSRFVGQFVSAGRTPNFYRLTSPRKFHGTPVDRFRAAAKAALKTAGAAARTTRESATTT